MLLARREHSRSELRGKLLPLARQHHETAPPLAEAAQPSPEQCVDDLLTWLEAQGYLSEQRFIESRLHARLPRYGNVRIRHELAEHGLALDAAAEQQLRDSELDRARQAWQRRFDALPRDVSERARQMRFLAQRGFSADVIRRVLRDGTG
jgi:regulatory protein